MEKDQVTVPLRMPNGLTWAVTVIHLSTIIQPLTAYPSSLENMWKWFSFLSMTSQC